MDHLPASERIESDGAAAPAQPINGAPSGGLRDPGNRGMAALSWFVVALIVGVILLANALLGPDDTIEVATEPTPTAGVLKLFGRYAVGAIEGAERSGFGGSVVETKDQLLAQLESVATSRDDHLRVALIAYELDDPERARAQLELATRPVDDDSDVDGSENVVEGIADGAAFDAAEESMEGETGAIADYVFADAARIEMLIADGAAGLSVDDRTALLDHHEWFAEIALTHDLPESDPDREAAVSAAVKVVYAMLGLGALAVTGLLIGIALFIVLLVKGARGRLKKRNAPPAPGGSVYIETFALFLAAFLGVQLLGDLLHSITGFDLNWLLIWLLPLILFWPMIRGARGVEAKYALGWHRGEGVAKEIGAGFVGYLAGLPIVGFGFLLAILLSALMSLLFPGPTAPPSHPVVQQADTQSALAIAQLYLLASVWAPLTEESMFRGALFHHLRGAMGAFFSSLLVGFIFAIIHPQGIVLVPPLMALGFVFALIREWRGSLIGPMFAHGLHNAVLITVLLIAMG